MIGLKTWEMLKQIRIDLRSHMQTFAMLTARIDAMQNEINMLRAGSSSGGGITAREAKFINHMFSLSKQQPENEGYAWNSTFTLYDGDITNMITYFRVFYMDPNFMEDNNGNPTKGWYGLRRLYARWRGSAFG